MSGDRRAVKPAELLPPVAFPSVAFDPTAVAAAAAAAAAMRAQIAAASPISHDVQGQAPGVCVWQPPPPLQQQVAPAPPAGANAAAAAAAAPAAKRSRQQQQHDDQQQQQQQQLRQQPSPAEAAGARLSLVDAATVCTSRHRCLAALHTALAEQEEARVPPPALAVALTSALHAALSNACAAACAGAVRLLCEAGADPNAQDASRRPALHSWLTQLSSRPEQRGWTEGECGAVAAALLAHGADANLRDCWGKRCGERDGAAWVAPRLA